MKTLRLRSRADADVAEIIDYYDTNAPHVVHALIDELDSAFERIRRSPQTGSTRYAFEAGAPGLRHQAVRRFPFLVFYLEGMEEIVVIRVLHQRGDVVTRLEES